MIKKTWFKKVWFIPLFSIFMACNAEPPPIKIGFDSCHYCKMTIADAEFGAEIINKKGKAFKFDDTYCVVEFIKEKTIDVADIKEIWLINFDKPHNFILAEKAFLLESPEIRSPMGGNIAAFETNERREEMSNQLKSPYKTISWQEVVRGK